MTIERTSLTHHTCHALLKAALKAFAAKAANLGRTPAFWALWQRLNSELGGVSIFTYRDQQSSSGSDGAECFDSGFYFTGWNGRVFEAHYDATAWRFEVPPQLQVFLGQLPLKIVTWWKTRASGMSSTDAWWVTFHVLYLDFQTTFGCPGPIRVSKSWTEWSMRPFVTPEQNCHGVRLRWFRQPL